MPLVKRRHCELADGGVLGYGGAVVEGEVNGVVVDALVFVLVVELEVEIQGAVSSVEGFVQRRRVEFLDRAGGLGGTEAEPHEEGGEAESEDEAAAAAAASAVSLRHGGGGGGGGGWVCFFPGLPERSGWGWGWKHIGGMIGVVFSQ